MTKTTNNNYREKGIIIVVWYLFRWTTCRASERSCHIRLVIRRVFIAGVAGGNAACFVVPENGLLFSIYVYGSMSRSVVCVHSTKSLCAGGFIVKMDARRVDANAFRVISNKHRYIG